MGCAQQQKMRGSGMLPEAVPKKELGIRNKATILLLELVTVLSCLSYGIQVLEISPLLVKFKFLNLSAGSYIYTY